MMAGRSEVKTPNSSSSEFRVSSESVNEVGWGKGSEDEVDAECLYCSGLFTKDHDGEEWVRCPKMSKWAHTVILLFCKIK
jgi:hypothetical protein